MKRKVLITSLGFAVVSSIWGITLSTPPQVAPIHADAAAPVTMEDTHIGPCFYHQPLQDIQGIAKNLVLDANVPAQPELHVPLKGLYNTPDHSLELINNEYTGQVYYIGINGNSPYKTPRGIHIGSTKQEVLQAYGSPSDTSVPNFLTYNINGKDTLRLIFILNDNNRVSTIVIAGDDDLEPMTRQDITTFTPVGNGKLLRDRYPEETYTITSSDNKKYTFRWVTLSEYNRFLELVDSRNQVVLKLKDPYMDGNGAYYIGELQAHNPDFKVWMLIDVEGSGRYCNGFWIIGEYKGKIVKFLDRSSLFAMTGDNIMRYHLYPDLTSDGIEVKLSNSYVLPGQSNAAGTRYKDIVNMKIFWDKKANWFGIEYGK